jgi:hypothetical protein
MPHIPVYVDAGFMGIQYGYCGVLPPIFICTLCGVTQIAYVSGGPVPQQRRLPGGPNTVAPVVRADAGASGSEVRKLLIEAAGTLLDHVAGKWGDQIGTGSGNYVSSWFDGGGQSFQGNGDGYYGGGQYY